MANKNKVKVLTKAQQLLLLKSKYTIEKYSLKNNSLTWQQWLASSETSKKYLVDFEYEKNNYPRVYIRNQEILRNAEDLVPHCYERIYKNEDNQKVRLCLFYPKNKEWTSSMSISDTIIPWTIEWLYYYELWRITGKWFGKGIHDVNKKD